MASNYHTLFYSDGVSAACAIGSGGDDSHDECDAENNGDDCFFCPSLTSSSSFSHEQQQEQSPTPTATPCIQSPFRTETEKTSSIQQPLAARQMNHFYSNYNYTNGDGGGCQYCVRDALVRLAAEDDGFFSSSSFTGCYAYHHNDCTVAQTQKKNSDDDGNNKKTQVLKSNKTHCTCKHCVYQNNRPLKMGFGDANLQISNKCPFQNDSDSSSSPVVVFPCGFSTHSPPENKSDSTNSRTTTTTMTTIYMDPSDECFHCRHHCQHDRQHNTICMISKQKDLVLRANTVSEHIRVSDLFFCTSLHPFVSDYETLLQKARHDTQRTFSANVFFSSAIQLLRTSFPTVLHQTTHTNNHDDDDDNVVAVVGTTTNDDEDMSEKRRYSSQPQCRSVYIKNRHILFNNSTFALPCILFRRHVPDITSLLLGCVKKNKKNRQCMKTYRCHLISYDCNIVHLFLINIGHRFQCFAKSAMTDNSRLLECLKEQLLYGVEQLVKQVGSCIACELFLQDFIMYEMNDKNEHHHHQTTTTTTHPNNHHLLDMSGKTWNMMALLFALVDIVDTSFLFSILNIFLAKMNFKQAMTVIVRMVSDTRYFFQDNRVADEWCPYLAKLPTHVSEEHIAEWVHEKRQQLLDSHPKMITTLVLTNIMMKIPRSFELYDNDDIDSNHDSARYHQTDPALHGNAPIQSEIECPTTNKIYLERMTTSASLDEELQQDILLQEEQEEEQKGQQTFFRYEQTFSDHEMLNRIEHETIDVEMDFD